MENRKKISLEELKHAIAWCMGVSPKCIYHDAEKDVFLVEEFIPYPCYDSGGSVDSIGYDSDFTEVTMEQAYRYYEVEEEFYLMTQQELMQVIAPYTPKEHDDELPF